MVSIAAFQAVDPGSIPGQRMFELLFFFLFFFFYLNIIFIALTDVHIKRYDQEMGKY